MGFLKFAGGGDAISGICAASGWGAVSGSCAGASDCAGGGASECGGALGSGTIWVNARAGQQRRSTPQTDSGVDLPLIFWNPKAFARSLTQFPRRDDYFFEGHCMPISVRLSRAVLFNVVVFRWQVC